jgi:hypothetical protein
MVSQTGNPQGEVPLLPRPASGVVTTYCFCVWSWLSAASLKFCAIATVWCCAVLMPAALAAADVGRHIAAAVMPLPTSSDMAKPGANASPLVTVRTTTHHLPHSGYALSGVPSPTGSVGRLRPTPGGGQRIYWAFICGGHGSRIHSTELGTSAEGGALHRSSTSAA